MSKKEYWKGIEQLTNDPDFVKYAEREFPQQLPIKDAYGDNSNGLSTNRRDFLKMMGFSVAAVALAACEAPVRKAIPYLNKPEEVEPGVANYYASTYVDGSDVCPVVVKTREGRPIFIEGNTFSSMTKGGTSARVNASVMMLYDNDKAQHASKKGEKIDWKQLDTEVTAALKTAGKVVIVAPTISSPSTRAALASFASKYGADVVSYDTQSVSALLEANRKQFGKAVVPAYHFDKAKTVVSFGADFLGTWVSPIEYTAKFMETRKVGPAKKDMSALYVFEPMLSITGASADYRTPVRPSQEGLAVAALYNEIARATGKPAVQVAAVKLPNVKEAAKALLASKGQSIVVSGINNPSVQLLVNGINEMLGNYGTTIDLATPAFVRQGSDAAMNQFVDQLKAGQVGAVVFYNTNPVYDHPRGKEIAAAIGKAKLSVSTADRLNETAAACTYLAPDTHFLEAWNDAEPKKGFFALSQPTISRIFDTRQAQDSFLTWAEDGRTFEEVIKGYWKKNLFGLQNQEADFESFWVRALHNGVLEVASASSLNEQSINALAGRPEVAAAVNVPADLTAVAAAINKQYKANATGTELLVFMPTVLGDGAQANNPMLQETPDPITKVCWGNYLALPIGLAKELGVGEFETKKNVVKVSTAKGELELPVVIQPGLAKGVVAVPMGYGRGEGAGKVAAEAAGFNAATLLTLVDGFVQPSLSGVNATMTDKKEDLAQTQTHETIMGRESIIQETTLAEYKKNPAAARYQVMVTSYQGSEKPADISLWDVNNDGYAKKEGEANADSAILWNDALNTDADKHTYPDHHWGLAIDLNTCTGCSACVVACHTENNVPVVGKQEVVNRREMHWIRIDRYYSQRPEEEFSADEQKSLSDFDKMERAAENPEVVFQPMMCQHCNNAPCETVCPVAATTHSSEGLNQMTYNRCVGTKYCANNCPYKVRRFNWFKYHDNNEFDYHMNNDLGKMVLNPDVTVRSRGVMEKCSMCVQRLQAGKLKAKREGRAMVDGDASVACATACPSDAIIFGDLNDKSSAIRQLMDGELKERAYNVLEEINVRPNVYYLAKVRNKDGQHA